MKNAVQLQNVGLDRFGREVCIGFVPSFQAVTRLIPPSAPSALLLAADVTELSPECLHAVAMHVLDRGAVYVMCWGAGSAQLEDAVDEAAVVRDLDENEPVIMTTSHEGEQLEEVLHFAVTAAQPTAEYVSACRTVVVLICNNVNWYNEALHILESRLSS